MLTTTGVIALAFGTIFVTRRELTTNTQAPAAQPQVEARDATIAPAPGEEGSYQEQVNFLLPDAYVLTNFEESTGEPGWHSYDSWWNSGS
jgi:hypothetical protein